MRSAPAIRACNQEHGLTARWKAKLIAMLGIHKVIMYKGIQYAHGDSNNGRTAMVQLCFAPHASEHEQRM